MRKTAVIVGAIVCLCAQRGPADDFGVDVGQLAAAAHQPQAAAAAQQAARAASAAAASAAGSIPALPSGDARFKGVFNDGWRVMIEALRAPACRKFFMSQGVTPEQALGTASGAEYRFLPLSQPGIGAQTNAPDSVFINSQGLFVTAEGGKIALGSDRYDLQSESNIRGMILLHELGHQTGIFGPDAGPKLAQLNAEHSTLIIRNCFPLRSMPIQD